MILIPYEFQLLAIIQFHLQLEISKGHFSKTWEVW